MKLTPEALNMVAQCISDGVYIDIETDGVLETEVWCNDCMEHSAAKIALKGMSDKGTYDLGTLVYCALHDGTEE